MKFLPAILTIAFLGVASLPASASSTVLFSSKSAVGGDTDGAISVARASAQNEVTAQCRARGGRSVLYRGGWANDPGLSVQGCEALRNGNTRCRVNYQMSCIFD